MNIIKFIEIKAQEKDDEVKGEGNSINYKYRMHDPRIGRFFTVDPLTKKYPQYSPYSFSGNKVIHAVELEGLEEVIIIGGAHLSSSESESGDGMDERNEASQTTIQIADEIIEFWEKNGLEKLNVSVLAPEPFNNDVYQTIYRVTNYLDDNLEEGEALIIYGYSLGGIAAQRVTRELEEKYENVQLLITVDAAYGPLSGVVDRTIPENVEKNKNYYQTKAPGVFSKGGKNKRANGSESGIGNKKVDDTSHGQIDEQVKDDVINDIKKALKGTSDYNQSQDKKSR